MFENTSTVLDTDVVNILGTPHKVVLFNDDHNNMLAVALQIIKAVKCSSDQAMAFMLEAHETGATVVFTGNKERCELVDSILAGPPTTLSTAIEPA